MDATQPLTRPGNPVGNSPSLGVPSGGWRWAALAFVLLALGAAALTVAAPQMAGLAGYALLVGIALVAGLFFYAVWPRPGRATTDALRVAEAAAKANVAWAITGEGGAVLDCNHVYRRMAGVGDSETPPPPELALGGEVSAAVLYRLTRDAGEGRAREESFQVLPGLEIVAAVRPLPENQSVWWFTPRLAASGQPQPVLTRAAAQQQPSIAQPAAAEPVPEPAPTQPFVNAGELFRDAPVGVGFADAAGTLLDANPALARFFGAADLPEGSLAGRSFTDLVDQADRARVLSLIGRAAAGQTGLAAIELRGGNTVTGEERMAELFAAPLGGDMQGNVVLYLLDVSEQKSLETKFAQSQKLQAVGQLAGGVAHDFNNLLTVIIGNCEFLLMRHPAGDPSFKEINEVHQNALRAANLVGQLLAFSRKQTMQPKQLALGEVIGELAQMLRRLVGEGIALEVERDADLWPVHADEAQLSNAIINLVVNARDAMPGGGTVTIATANETVPHSSALGTAIMPAGDYVCIAVTDTGTGMSKETQSKIFDPFFTTKPVGQGTGLGLATVYGIVKQTGGFITVDSELGQGATFRIYLPRFRGEAPAPVEVMPAAPRDVTGQDTILLVEDEEAVRSFAARALRMRGYHVLEAGGGEEALEIVRDPAVHIDLVITDVVMPNMDGPTLVRHVQELKPGLAVIFMSGYAEEAFRKSDQSSEDIHFLPKPFGLKQLAAKVKEVLSGAPSARRGG
ncbi:MAG: response regulator [Alphaproteobacteria bacterium]|nr:response regulator [Alphaproteobacteria bacterium]